MKRKIVFLTGTRADYGKIKSLLKAVEADAQFELEVFVTGMHLLPQFGVTYQEVVKDGYEHVFIAFDSYYTESMSYNLGQVVSQFTGYVNHRRPDAIVVHGDRIEALAGAMVGALNNIHVIHIEGGEVSGTIDESIRHAISKFAHTHLVANAEAERRLTQMGEAPASIYVIGSPDIDIMLSLELPSLDEVKAHYDIPFDTYGIVLFHPVTTEYTSMRAQTEAMVAALKESDGNYVVVYPNNDHGAELILDVYRHELAGNEHFRVFPSIRFERFLTLLKHATCLCGNSSAGIRETSIYGVPAIDIGTRQRGRYNPAETKNIQHVAPDREAILDALANVDAHRVSGFHYGSGDATRLFMDLIRTDAFWSIDLQKYFHQV